MSVSVGGKKTLFTRENIITYVIALIGLGLVVYGVVTFVQWASIDAQAIAEDRVAREDGLSRQQQAQLFQAQFERAADLKNGIGQQALLLLILGIIVIGVSRWWPNWRDLYGEQMLYGYAFALPPVGWVLYLFAYKTKGDPNREIIRRNIGIMSLALVAAGIVYGIMYALQNFVILALFAPDPNATGVVVNVIKFIAAPQFALFVAIVFGGYVSSMTRDVRAIAVTLQLVALALVLVVFWWLGGNAQRGMAERGLTATDYTFLDLTAGFDISETLLQYDRNSSYGRAFVVGALNTLMISFTGIALASMLGLLVGVARLSTNWLTRTIARVFVELMRNVPLLVLLFFIYAGVLLQLPTRENTLEFFGGAILLNNRGVALTWPEATATFDMWIPFLVIGAIIGAVVWYFRNRTIKVTGRPAFNFGYVLLGFAAVPFVGLFVVNPLSIATPFIDGLNYAKHDDDTFIGLVMSPQFFGLLSGLVLYTGAYIGEVVRAGILSVSKGQREASTALGLTQTQSLQLIILPQALRVIIPPLTNQYLNLAKNSSLAIAIGYADLYFVANTTFNQSGQSVQVVLMIMASYLFLSLVISAVMNFLNTRIQIKER